MFRLKLESNIRAIKYKYVYIDIENNHKNVFYQGEF